MTDFDHADESRIDELLALAALGELTEADERELDLALAADDSLAAELDADLTTAAELQSAAPVTPPALLKANVLDAIADTPQLAAAETQLAAAETQLAAAETQLGAAPAVADNELDAARRARRRRWMPLAAAAAVAMLFVGGIVATRQDGGGGGSFAAVVEADDAQVRDLTGALDGSLRVVYSPTESAFAVDGDDVALLDARQTYQIWLIDGAVARSVGLFRPDDTGRVEVVFDDVDPTGLVVGVTVEPAAGSETPTLPIVASA